MADEQKPESDFHFDLQIPDRAPDDHEQLLQNIAANLESLQTLLAQAEDSAEDRIYRFYHQSFKVYHLQRVTQEIVARLQALAPDRQLNDWFLKIVKEGTGKEWSRASNDNWTGDTRPILEAFFHAHYFLAMICKYGKELGSPPVILPSGWAAALYLFNLR